MRQFFAQKRADALGSPQFRTKRSLQKYPILVLAMSLMRLRFGAVLSPIARGDTQRASLVDTDKGEEPSSYNAPHLARNAANFTALTPLTFLPRAATESAQGTPSPSWRQTYRHCSRRITACQWQGRF